MKNIKSPTAFILALLAVQLVAIIISFYFSWNSYIVGHGESIAFTAVFSVITIALSIPCIIIKENRTKLYKAVALVMPLVTLVGFLLILSAWGMYGMFFPVISLGLFIAMFFSLKPLTDIKIIIGTLYSIATGFIVIIVFFYVVSGGQFFGHTEIITSSLSPNELFYVEISQHSTGATGGSSRIVVQSYPLGRSRIVYSGRWHSLKSSSQENGTVIIWEGDYIFRVRVADVRSLTFRYIDGKWQMTFPTRTRN